MYMFMHPATSKDLCMSVRLTTTINPSLVQRPVIALATQQLRWCTVLHVNQCCLFQVWPTTVQPAIA